MKGPIWKDTKKFWKVTLTIEEFYLGKPMFVVDLLDRVLANYCKSGAMDVKLGDGQVDT